MSKLQNLFIFALPGSATFRVRKKSCKKLQSDKLKYFTKIWFDVYCIIHGIYRAILVIFASLFFIFETRYSKFPVIWKLCFFL